MRLHCQLNRIPIHFGETTEDVSIKKNHHSLLVSLPTGIATLEISVKLLKKLKINVQDSPAISLIAICPKKFTSYSTDTCSPIFNCPFTPNS